MYFVLAILLLATTTACSQQQSPPPQPAGVFCDVLGSPEEVREACEKIAAVHASPGCCWTLTETGPNGQVIKFGPYESKEACEKDIPDKESAYHAASASCARDERSSQHTKARQRQSSARGQAPRGAEETALI